MLKMDALIQGLLMYIKLLIKIAEKIEIKNLTFNFGEKQ